MQNVSNYPLEEYALIADPKQLVMINAPYSYRYHKATIDEVSNLVRDFILHLLRSPKQKAHNALFVVHPTMVTLTTTRVETLFDELEYIEVRPKALEVR